MTRALMSMLDIARSQVGVKEATGNNDGIPAERYNRGDKLPWCAAFVLWCNQQSDQEPIARTAGEFYAFRAVQAFEDEMKARGWWFASGGGGLLPADLIFFASRGGSDAGTGRHMGIVVRLTSASLSIPPHRVETIEGNYGNAVSRVSHDLLLPAEKNRITGYATVPFKKVTFSSAPP